LVTLSPKYELLGTDSKFSIVTGGRGSGKSFGVALLTLLLSYERGHTILFTRYTLRSAAISIIPEFLEKIELLGRDGDFAVTKDEIINRKSGTRILFRGIKTSSGDQTANLKSITGLSTWVLDEAEELMDEDKFDTINLSVRQKGVQNRVILMMNPTTKEHWIYRRFFQERGVSGGWNGTKEDVNYIHTTYLDNSTNLSPSYIKDIERLKRTNLSKFEHKIMGGWLDKAEGVVFQNWEFGDFNPDGLQTSFGLDFGFSIDPDALTEVAIDKTKRVIYLRECIYEKGLQTNVLSERLNAITDKRLIIADSAEPRLIADLKSRGANIQAVKKGTIESGVQMLLDYKLVVSPESSNLAKELNNYTYSDRASKLYIDDWNHLLDGIRYNVTYHLDNPHKGKYYV